MEGIPLPNPRPISIRRLPGVTAQYIQDLAKRILGGAKQVVYLSLENIVLQRQLCEYFDIYLNLPPSEKPSPSSQYYLGTLTHFGFDHHEVAHGATGYYLRFTLSRDLLGLLTKDANTFDVKFVSASGVVMGKAALARQASVNIGRIQLLEMGSFDDAKRR